MNANRPEIGTTCVSWIEGDAGLQTGLEYYTLVNYL